MNLMRKLFMLLGALGALILLVLVSMLWGWPAVALAVVNTVWGIEVARRSRKSSAASQRP